MKIISLVLLACVQALPIMATAVPAETPAALFSQDVQYRKSLEFEALANEVYRSAIASIAEERKNTQGSFAVVLDLDETVLDNTEYQIENNDQYNATAWKAWVARRAAGLVPGSKDFLDEVRAIPGAHVVFITDRGDEQKADTQANMVALGVFKAGDLLLTRQNAQDNKGVRRDCVEKAADPRCSAEGPLPITALFGDSARDFEERFGDDMNSDGRASIVANAGSKYWIIPNPMYGQWQQNYK